MKYVIVISDKAEADRDRLYLARSRQDLDYAKQWSVIFLLRLLHGPQVLLPDEQAPG